VNGNQSPSERTPYPRPSGSAVPSPLQGDYSGLIPGIVQDAESGQVLMLGYLNQEAIDLTVETGFVHFWSRSRQEMWKKGETSGNTLRFVDMTGDCDSDALLIRANPDGPTCHTGEVSCFDGGGSRVAGAPLPPPSLRSAQEPSPQGGTDGEVLPPFQGDYSLAGLWRTIQERKRGRPERSYTVQLMDGGVDLVGRKVLEEAGEVLMAAKDHANGVADDRRVAEEAGDVIYHLLALLAEREIPLDEVFSVLQERSQ
jgi:phosphoribosyl-ATP pyrophosphohydrolase/phosphoribosyl-AMP cyclohydrolase